MAERLTMGQAMVKARLATGLRQSELAFRANLTPQTVSNYETDKVSPGIMNLVTLADVLGLPLDEYIGRTPPQKPEGEYYGL